MSFERCHYSFCFFVPKSFRAARIVRVIALAFFLLSAFVLSSQHSFASDDGRVYEDKYAAYVVDVETGEVLYQKNATKKLHPASLTKMMTLLMVFDAIDRGKLKLHHRVRISEHAASMVPSKLDLPVGSTIKVEDAILALTTKSANDVAAAIGEKLGGGSEKNFARLMTRMAWRIGMTDTRFRNASGLHDPKQVSTARDMSKLARVLLDKYGRHYHYFSTRRFTYKGKTYKSHNKLLDSYAGMDGFKTGYIRAAGFNLVSSAKRGDRRLVGVVFGGRTGNLRNEEMARIMDHSFAKVNAMPLVAKVIPVPEEKPVLAPTKTAALVNKPLAITVPDADAALTPAQLNGRRWAMLNPSQVDGVLQRISGQGDIDMSARGRIEAGLISISSYLGQPIPASAMYKEKFVPVPDHARFENASYDSGEWEIQVGAFSKRESSQKVLDKALLELPPVLRNATSYIAPMKTPEGWIYRGRIKGYSKVAAYDACDILAECIPVAPDKEPARLNQ